MEDVTDNITTVPCCLARSNSFHIMTSLVAEAVLLVALLCIEAVVVIK